MRDGKVVETRSWLVRPPGNWYFYVNTQIHGIHPSDTENSPAFPEVWNEIMEYVKRCPVLVAHNAAFDMSCIRHSLELYDLESQMSSITVPCVPPAGFMTLAAIAWTIFATISRYPMDSTTVPGMTRRCVPAFPEGNKRRGLAVIGGDGVLRRKTVDLPRKISLME